VVGGPVAVSLIVTSTDHASAAADSAEGGEKRRRHRWLRWLLGAVVAIVVLVAGAVTAFVVLTRNPEPGAFYDDPEEVPAPGTTPAPRHPTGALPDVAAPFRHTGRSTSRANRAGAWTQ
jgi:hypothetical protein